MNGSLYTWSNLNQYFASYLKHNGNPSIVPEDTSFLMPSIFLVQYCFMTIGVYLGNKVGPRFSTLIGILFMYISYVIMIFFSNYYLVLAAMGIFGLGDGLANLSVINNCWKYFPENKALINGEHVEPNEDKIYPKQIADRLLNFLYFLFIFFLVLGAFAVCFTFKYQDDIIISEKDEIGNEEKDLDTKKVSALKMMCEGFFTFKNFILSLFCFCGPCN